MATFPTLSRNPVYPIKKGYVDTTLKQTSETGYVMTRPRSSRIQRTWEVEYQGLVASDSTAIDEFMVTVKGGSDYFDWTNIEDGDTYSVRFDKPPELSAVNMGNGVIVYDLSFKLNEV